MQDQQYITYAMELVCSRMMWVTASLQLLAEAMFALEGGTGVATLDGCVIFFFLRLGHPKDPTKP